MLLVWNIMCGFGDYYNRGCLLENYGNILLV